MSFRYTNHLVGAMKHRLHLEAAHRSIARRTFTGTCNGVEVKCSGYGTVLSIRMIDKAVWTPHYELVDAAPSSSAAPSADLAAAATTEAVKPPSRRGVDLIKLSTSIKAATWIAIQQIRSAKEEAHSRSLRGNPQLLAEANLRHWYEQDANTIFPRFFDALKNELATPFIQAVRFGLNDPQRFLSGSGNAKKTAAGPRTTVSVLEEQDCDPRQIPIGSTHPLFAPALIGLEAAVPTGVNSSRVDEKRILSEQRKEMCRDEQLFWERVELIRRSQMAAIPKGVKRNYAEMSSIIKDEVEEKVQLRFTS